MIPRSGTPCCGGSAGKDTKNMPDNNISRLYREIKEKQSVSAHYAPFLQAMEALDAEMSGLMEADEHGWKLLDAERYRSLTDKYRTAGTSLEEYMKQTEKSTDPAEIELRKKVALLGELMAADTAVLHHYRPKTEKEQKSLPTLLEEARIPVLDQGSKVIRSVHGCQSNRMPMTIIGPDGQPMDGMFTIAQIYDPLGAVNDALSSAAEKAATEEGRELLRNLMNAYKAYYTQNPDPNKPVNDDPNMVLRFLANTAKNTGILSYALDTDKMAAEIARVNGMTPQAVKTAVGKSALKNLASGLKEPYADICLKTAEAKMENKTRLDRKNTGMSRVADLLGLSHVICHSQPMKLKGPDGKIVDGTFMAFADGVDPSQPDSRGFFLDRDTMKNAKASAFEAISDLQVLDYLCGNTDRHGFNVFYQVDEDGNLIGVQGIDNDNSFGGIRMQDHRTRRMPLPATMGVISRKTAAQVMQLTPSELKFTLRGIIDEPSIKAACERLKILQKTIALSREKLPSNNKSIQYPYIRELEGEEFKKADLQTLIDERIHNHFCECKQVACGIAGRPRGTGASIALIGATNRATEGGVTGQILQAKAFTKKLSDCTSFWRGSSSQNYLDLEQAVRDYQALQEKIRTRMESMKAKVKADAGDISPETFFGQYVTAFDMNKMRASLKKLKTAADKYADTKSAAMEAAGKSLDDDKYIKERIKTAREISRFAEKGLQLSDEEKEALASNDRRAVEQYARVTNAKEKQKAEENDSLIIRKDSGTENDLIRNSAGPESNLIKT